MWSRKVHTKLHPGLEWRIFHILTGEDIDDVISRFYTVCAKILLSITLGTRGFLSLTSGEIGRHNREHKLQPKTAQEKPLAPRVLVYIIKRKLHGGLKIWILFSRGKKTIFYSLAALPRKILFSPLENKIYIFAPPVISSIYGSVTWTGTLKFVMKKPLYIYVKILNKSLIESERKLASYGSAIFRPLRTDFICPIFAHFPRKTSFRTKLDGRCGEATCVRSGDGFSSWFEWRIAGWDIEINTKKNLVAIEWRWLWDR